MKLEPPDSHYLNAATGWIELGNPAEAQHELERLSEEARRLPEVLEVQWNLHALARKWEAALRVAERLVAEAPESCSGWIDRSYSLHELKRTGEAREKLLPAAARFPQVSTIPYNLACYDCQLGDLAKARQWLALAMNLGRREVVLAMALKDPDLKPLWRDLTKRD
jgi:Flp pilus assembly protein TadD